ncbi:MAG: VOC family protein [Acidimicrobiales bacterium]
MTPDPLDALRLPDEPVAPRPEFAARLRRQIEVALDLTDQTDLTDRTHDPRSAAMPTPTPTPTAVSTQLVPYLVVDGATAAIEFYVAAFGAVETMRLMQPDGRVGHAELTIGTAALMLADEFPEMGILGPAARGGTSVSLHLVVPDVDATVAAALEAGATLERPVADQFYGNRSGIVVDPFGHRWIVQTPIEEISAEEMQRRLDELDSGS